MTAPCDSFVGGYTCNCPGMYFYTRIFYHELFQLEQQALIVILIQMIVLLGGKMSVMTLTKTPHALMGLILIHVFVMTSILDPTVMRVSFY